MIIALFNSLFSLPFKEKKGRGLGGSFFSIDYSG